MVSIMPGLLPRPKQAKPGGVKKGGKGRASSQPDTNPRANEPATNVTNTGLTRKARVPSGPENAPARASRVRTEKGDQKSTGGATNEAIGKIKLGNRNY